VKGLTFQPAQEIQNYYKIKDLKNEWKVYSRKEEALVPYIESVNSRLNNIYISLNPEDYRSNGILLKFKSKAALFINNQLIYNASSPGQTVMSIDSLVNLSGQGTLLISIYAPRGIQDLETSIVSYSKKDPNILNRMDYLSILARGSGPIWDFIKIGVIIILILYVILLNIGGRVFNDYYNIINSFIRVSTDDFLSRTKKINRIDLVFIIVLSIVISFFIVITKYQFGSTAGEGSLDSIGKLFIKWLWLLISILIWIMLRIFIISLSSDLFKMRDIGTIHTFEFLRITNFYGLLVFLLLVLSLFIIQVNLNVVSHIILYSITIMSILRALILYLKFLNSSNYTKLYLFAYLCSAELLPVIVGLKFLLKSML